MRVYRVVWLVGCAAVALVGLVVGLVRVPATLLEVVFACAAVVAGSALAASRYRRRRRRGCARRVIGKAFVGGAAGGALVGLAALLGVGVLALGLLLVAASPYVIRAYVRALTAVPVSMAALGGWVSPPVDVGGQYGCLPAVPNVRLLTDERLRSAWRTSFLALQRWPPTNQVMATVEERRHYLDEFERRNPAGFKAWLASQAWASNIPARYLRDDHTTQPEINWDELTRQHDA